MYQGGEARKITRLHDKVSCLLEELRIQMDPILLTICTVPYNMMFDQHALEHEREGAEPKQGDKRHPPEECAPCQTVGTWQSAWRKEGFPEDTSSDGIHF